MLSGLKKSILRYFPAPRSLTMPAVGFEVSPEAVRFMEIKKSSRGFRVARFGEKRLPEGDSDVDNFLEGERFKKAVAELRDGHKLSSVRSALPEGKVYLFATDIPRLSPNEMRSAIELKLEENVPIPASDSVFDFRIMETHAERDHVNVSVSVAPTLLVSRYLEFFEKQGLIPLGLEVRAQAVARAVIPADNKETIIIANIGGSESGLYIADCGIVHFTSTISFGSEVLTEAVKKHFKTTTADAVKIKEERGIVKDKENIELFFSMASTLSVLKDEVNKLIAYWDTHQERYTEKRKKVGKIILCGREAPLPGLVEYLSSGFSVPVSLANVWTNVFSLEDYIPPIPFRDSLSYATVIGLALPKL